jgi:hypothetical protein
VHWLSTYVCPAGSECFTKISWLRRSLNELINLFKFKQFQSSSAKLSYLGVGVRYLSDMGLSVVWFVHWFCISALKAKHTANSKQIAKKTNISIAHFMIMNAQ